MFYGGSSQLTRLQFDVHWGTEFPPFLLKTQLVPEYLLTECFLNNGSNIFLVVTSAVGSVFIKQFSYKLQNSLSILSLNIAGEWGLTTIVRRNKSWNKNKNPATIPLLALEASSFSYWSEQISITRLPFF